MRGRGRRAASTRLALPPLLALAAPPGPRGRRGRRTCSWRTRRTSPSASSATTGARRRSSIRRWTSITSSACRRAPEDFYLAFGRVVPYKRVDLAVAACARLGGRLKVAGDGRALDGGARRGGRRASSSSARSPRSERDALLSGARALLFPGEEDFGIVPVEAQAAGVPVIAYGVGGARGVRPRRASPGCCSPSRPRPASRRRSSASRRSALDADVVRENARRFGRERFREQLAGVIAGAHAG